MKSKAKPERWFRWIRRDRSEPERRPLFPRRLRRCRRRLGYGQSPGCLLREITRCTCVNSARERRYPMAVCSCLVLCGMISARASRCHAEQIDSASLSRALSGLSNLAQSASRLSHARKRVGVQLSTWVDGVVAGARAVYRGACKICLTLCVSVQASSAGRHTSPGLTSFRFFILPEASLRRRPDDGPLSSFSFAEVTDQTRHRAS